MHGLHVAASACRAFTHTTHKCCLTSYPSYLDTTSPDICSTTRSLDKSFVSIVSRFEGERLFDPIHSPTGYPRSVSACPFLTHANDVFQIFRVFKATNMEDIRTSQEDLLLNDAPVIATNSAAVPKGSRDSGNGSNRRRGRKARALMADKGRVLQTPPNETQSSSSKRNRDQIKGNTPTEHTPTVKKPKAKQKSVSSAVSTVAIKQPAALIPTTDINNGAASQVNTSFADAIKSACLSIVLVSKDGNIREDQLNSIRNKLNALIIEAIKKGEKPPTFDGFVLNDGNVSVACADAHSKLWMDKNVHQLNGLWKDAEFNAYDADALPKKPKLMSMCIWFPSVKESHSDMMKLLKAQNNGLDISSWRHWGRHKQDSGIRHTFGVDAKTIEWVKDHKNVLYYGIDTAKCNFPTKNKARKPKSEKLDAIAPTNEEPKVAVSTIKEHQVPQIDLTSDGPLPMDTDAVNDLTNQVTAIVEDHAKADQASQASTTTSIRENMDTTCHIGGEGPVPEATSSAGVGSSKDEGNI